MALRALRERRRRATPATIVDRALAKLEEAAARSRRPQVDPGEPCRPPVRPAWPRWSDADRRRPAGAAELLRARPRRAVRAGRRPARVVSPPTATTTSTPGATAPRRRGCSGSTGSTRPRCSTARSRPSRRSRATSPPGCSPAARTDARDPRAGAGGPLGRRLLPGAGGPAGAARAAPRSTSGSATSCGSCACCSASRPARVVARRRPSRGGRRSATGRLCALYDHRCGLDSKQTSDPRQDSSCWPLIATSARPSCSSSWRSSCCSSVPPSCPSWLAAAAVPCASSRPRPRA